MKRFYELFIMAVVFSFFMISCGDDTKKHVAVDEDTAGATDEDAADEVATDLDVVQEDGDVEGDDAVDEAADEDVADPCVEMECPEHSECVADGEEAECVCDEGYHPTNGECISDTEMTEIGDFTLSFTGAINATNDPSAITPGTGDAEFTYFDEDFTFTVLHVDNESIKIDFPFASSAQEGLVTATWIDAISFTPKFFAINVPDNLAVGTDIDFVENQAYALYGDLSYDGSTVGIKCIRAVSGEALLDIIELSASQMEVTAAGKLIDPVYATELGYNLPEVCAD